MRTPAIEVILTHEHTDFDALASMLAASLLFPDAWPVLPIQLNRNVQEFLALYLNQFPFITRRELPRGHVMRAILVDTQKTNWVKGVDKCTQVDVIEHHPLAPDLSPEWHAKTEAVGANTTLLVEELIALEYTLSPVHATLLALGIHEDTGSLTFAATTQRDARALAWLLAPEHGVNLQVLNRFLQHRLSDAQRALLDVLIQQSEILEIAGHAVVIAQVSAPDFQDEISTLASRLHHYHEVDAVFLLIELADVIQIVARSSTDDIDVGEVARQVGGGGHRRAAAATIQTRQGQPPQLHTEETDNFSQAIRKDLHSRIVALLEQETETVVTVAQIMSPGHPQVLEPEMSVGQAAELMQRYGHEGFPVLEEKLGGRRQLIGLLTRREVDRAMMHKLHTVPVRRFMRVGQVSILPEASVSTLSKLMIDTAWGQIPVVDADGEIIGIVTRTDLIKLWDGRLADAGQLPTTVRSRLQKTLSPMQHALLEQIGREVEQLGFTIYVVGGFVRDLLFERKDEMTTPAQQHGVAALDMDIVIEGDAIEFAHHIKNQYGGRIVAHKRFGTAKWLLDDVEHPVLYHKLLSNRSEDDGKHSSGGNNGEESWVDLKKTDLPAHLDFISARTEFYTAPSVLPTVEPSSIKLDLHRRDFTINTLALCLNPDKWGHLLDFYGGLNDLQAGVIRVLHSLSFVDDPTRILRAVRYEQRFNFQIDARTLELLTDALPLLERLTPTRLRHEVERILQEKRPERSLLRLQTLGVLAYLHEELQVDSWISDRFARLRRTLASPTVSPVLRNTPIERLYWAILVIRLSESVQQALHIRLGLRGETQQLVEGVSLLCKNLALLRTPALTPRQAVALLDSAPYIAVEVLLITHSEDPTIVELLTRYKDVWQHIQPLLNGHDLQQIGVPRGPIYREILDGLRFAQVDGSIQNRAEAMAWVENFRERGN